MYSRSVFEGYPEGKRPKILFVPVGIGISDVALHDVAAAKTEIIALILNSANEANDLPKAVAAGKLVPVREGLYIPVGQMLPHDAIKGAFGQRINELTEHFFPLFMFAGI